MTYNFIDFHIIYCCSSTITLQPRLYLLWRCTSFKKHKQNCLIQKMYRRGKFCSVNNWKHGQAIEIVRQLEADILTISRGNSILVLSYFPKVSKYISECWPRLNFLKALANTFFVNITIKLFYCQKRLELPLSVVSINMLFGTSICRTKSIPFPFPNANAKSYLF